MTPPFVVLSLPRSRSFWLSRFLTAGGWQCGHDELRHCRSLDDVRSWLAQPLTGTVETAGAAFWRLLAQYAPDARLVVLRRPVAEVVDSLSHLGFDAAVTRPAMQRLDAKLVQVASRVPGVLSVTMAELDDEAACARVFEHCTGLPHSTEWWRTIAPLNLQTDMPATIRYFEAHKPQLEKLASVAKHRALAAMNRANSASFGRRRAPRELVRTARPSDIARTERPADDDGVTFQQEPFDQFYRDAGDCFAEHLVQTGQAPEDHAKKNLPMLRALDALGALSITTARCNGRMAGYLMAVYGPSLDSPDVTQAWNTIFFASDDFRGVGMKLQRASLEALRARGVDEVLMRAGVRGSGPRLGSLYRRLGAEDFGQVYRLQLEA